MLLLKSLVPWLAILCLAAANGALREAILIPMLGRSSGLVLSGILLSLLIALVSHLFVRRQSGIQGSQGLRIGALWLCLTLAFEFSFGRFFQNKSWPELFDAYTFREGNIWPIVLLITLLAPYVAALLHSRSRHANSDV